MKDQNKPKTRLIAELKEMRQRVYELKKKQARLVQTEKTLREDAKRYELIAVCDAIWDWDVPNHCIHFSPRWKELHGFAPDEVSDREEELSSGIHPDDVHRVMAAMQAHFEGKTEFYEEEYRIRCNNGGYKWILGRGFARRDAAGHVLRMTGFESDTTEAKGFEEILQLRGQTVQAPKTNVSSVNAFIFLTLQNIASSLLDLNHLTNRLTQKGLQTQEVCHLFNCPRQVVLLNALDETVKVLEKTKRSFKSKELGNLRKKLENIMNNKGIETE